MNYSSFADNVWEKTNVTGCKFREASLTGVKMKKVKFDTVDLTKTDLYHTSFKGIDLSSCVLEGNIFSEGLTELKGATVSAMQAVSIVNLLGVKVQ